jgi:hypothetical protein
MSASNNCEKLLVAVRRGEIEIRAPARRSLCMRMSVKLSHENSTGRRRFMYFASASAAAELTGSFYLEKETFARGEPIFLYLSLVNKGPDTAEFAISDPDQLACSGISIKERAAAASDAIRHLNRNDRGCPRSAQMRKSLSH